MNTLDAFKINPHSIYESNNYRFICCINLLEFGKTLFESAYVIDNLNKLKLLCETCGPSIPPKREQVEGFTYNGLVDSIKISICFENFGKCILLAKGYLVHNIDKEVFPNLEKEQKKRPILIEEFPGEWIESNKIITTVSSLKEVKKGLTMNTINYSTMLNRESYFQKCLYDEELLSFLKEINGNRNQLHLANSLNFVLKDNSYNLYNQLNEFVKTKFPKFKSQLMEHLPDNLDPNPSFIIK